MDMSLYPHAVAMSADEFMSWSTAMINDLMSSGTRRTIDKLTGPIWSWAMKNSMHPLHWGLACCALEMSQASASRFDAERYGMIYRSSPRQTDILLVNGWISKKIRNDIRRLWEEMPAPKWAVAMGECAISGGPWYDAYNCIQGLDQILPGSGIVHGSGHADGLAACSDNLLCDLVAGLLLPAGDDYGGAVLRHELGNGVADAAGGAGDDSDLAGQIIHFRIH